ncbi:unnamed protein product [Caenorhabditis angaria]|uniref:Uncharacterized protein n=1 Tax=Caenorhabditis angaria TaxID=860376 RepID=A0A9P1N6Q3_9PELO|nr:unnamed protein product [Caenorhabditis angaria]
MHKIPKLSNLAEIWITISTTLIGSIQFFKDFRVLIQKLNKNQQLSLVQFNYSKIFEF